MTKEALKLALEALESCDSGHISDGGRQWFDEELVDKAYAAIKEALAQLEQEPVDVSELKRLSDAIELRVETRAERMVIADKLRKLAYTTPPQRTWVGLTDENYNWIFEQARTGEHAVRLAEAKLKEKNNG